MLMLPGVGPNLSARLGEISVLGLAHVGDAVFELMARTWMVSQGSLTAKRLHKNTVALVSAKAQAAAARIILPELTQEEHAVFKRGRNASVNSVPRSSTHEEYHASTGIEALFGHLYLSGRFDRMDELFRIIVDHGL